MQDGRNIDFGGHTLIYCEGDKIIVKKLLILTRVYSPFSKPVIFAHTVLLQGRADKTSLKQRYCTKTFIWLNGHPLGYSSSDTFQIKASRLFYYDKMFLRLQKIVIQYQLYLTNASKNIAYTENIFKKILMTTHVS